MECCSLFYARLLKFDQNVILNVNHRCIDKIIDEETLIKGEDIFEINPPCTKPKPANLLSAWPPHDKCYFYHDYYNGSSTKFFCVGDHIAKFIPGEKEAVLALNRLHLLVLFTKTRCETPEQGEQVWYFQKLIASLKRDTKFTIFTNINFSAIHTEYVKDQEKESTRQAKAIKRKIEHRVNTRDAAIERYITKYDLETENLRTKLSAKMLFLS